MTKKTIIIGIAGASASGKSLLANTIVDEIGSNRVVVIHEDSYYRDNNHLSFEERARINYDHPDAFEHELLYQHLKKLQAGETVQVPIHDHKLYTRSSQTQLVGQHTIIVLEGVLLFVDPQLQ